MLLKYLERTSGYSRAEVTRLVTRWQRNRLAEVPLVKRYGRPTVPFARKYTPGDIALLVEMDKAHEDVYGPAIAHLLQRAYWAYGDPRYERLATLSVSHLYNLRQFTTTPNPVLYTATFNPSTRSPPYPASGSYLDWKVLATSAKNKALNACVVAILAPHTESGRSPPPQQIPRGATCTSRIYHTHALCRLPGSRKW